MAVVKLFGKLDLISLVVLLGVVTVVIGERNELTAQEDARQIWQMGEQRPPDFSPFTKHYHRLLYDDSLHKEVLQAFQRITIANEDSGQCLVDFLQFLGDLVQEKEYTFQVVDAIGKLPSGLTQGALFWMGSYDLCTNITQYKSNVSKDVTFQGKYCIANIKGPILTKVSPILTARGITIGLCVPSSCDASNIPVVANIALQAILKKLNVSSTSLNATDYSLCSEPAPWKAGDTAAVVISSFILFLVICGTLYDTVQRAIAVHKKSKESLASTLSEVNEHDRADLVNNEVNMHGNGVDMQVPPPAYEMITSQSRAKGVLHQFFMSFSVINNTEKLLKTGVSEGQLGAVNGIRVISMWWVILGHSYSFLMGNGGALFDNVTILPEIVRRFTFRAVSNATFSVDSFFFLSGLLVAYLLLKELRRCDGRPGVAFWPVLYFHRFWRLTPVYMYLLLMYATISLHLPEGPLMRAGDGGQKSCEKYWWTNLLYINNLHPKRLNDECMGWAWYLANDMQFFIISPVIIYLLYRFRYVGYAVVTGLIGINLIVTGVLARQHHMQPGIFGGTNKEWEYIYVQPWHRISPYLVGIATGYLIHKWQNNGRPKIYKACVVLGWCLAIAINMSVLYGLNGPMQTGKFWSDDVNALYVATSRFAWSLGLAWLTFACITGYGGPINTFLSWSVWAPLGRLTYCAYLVHPVVMMVYIDSVRKLFHYTDYMMIYTYIPHLVIAYCVAFVVSVCVEAPMLGLEKIIFKRKKD